MRTTVQVEPEVLQRAVTSRALQLILLPTEACNFRCTYCYEDFRLGRMEPWVVRGVKRLIERRIGGLDRLDLTWFGGEPLLARDVVFEILEHARSLASEYPALTFASDVTTNGWNLEPELFRRLLDLGARRYQITLDGEPELHDRRRVLAGGGATFERIWNNLLAMRAVEEPFEVVLRVHVDRSNHAQLPPFLHRCRAAFGHDSRFQVRLKPLSRWGGPNDREIALFEDDGEREHVLASLQAELGPPQPAVVPNTAADMCYAARGNSFLVRADGRLGKCTVALNDPRNDIGRIHEDGRLEIDSARAWPWMRGLESGVERDLLCPLMGMA
ncbi:MAG: radical SAM protein [Planctomycetota bacterium]